MAGCVPVGTTLQRSERAELEQPRPAGSWRVSWVTGLSRGTRPLLLCKLRLPNPCCHTAQAEAAWSFLQLQLAAQFGVWAQQHNKSYDTPEVSTVCQTSLVQQVTAPSFVLQGDELLVVLQAYKARFGVFQSNLEAIKQHNSEEHSWKVRPVHPHPADSSPGLLC